MSGIEIQRVNAAGEVIETVNNPVAQKKFSVPTLSGADKRGKHSCVFTIAQEELEFMPLWLTHYAKHFYPGDMYLLDHRGPGMVAHFLPAELEYSSLNVIRVHRNASFDHEWLCNTVSTFQHFLLQSYEWVVFAEADEFIVPDPEKYKTIPDFLRAQPSDLKCISTTGWEPVHRVALEPPLDVGKPILGQRRYAFRANGYDKPLVSRVPLSYSHGFHSAYDAQTVRSEDLYLFHLHRVDWDIACDRHERTAARVWSKEDIEGDRGSQNLIADEEALRRWGFNDTPTEVLPEKFYDVL